MTRLPALLLALCLFATASCDAGDPVIDYADDDASMNAAIEKARGSLDEFMAALSEGTADAYSVKVKITEDDHVEHIWMTNVSVDGDYFAGVIANEPASLDSVQVGDRYRVSRSKISDWMYTKGDKIHGAQTLRVMLKDMPADEAESFRKRLQE